MDQTESVLIIQHRERKKKKKKREKEMFNTQHQRRVKTEHTLKNFLAAAQPCIGEAPQSDSTCFEVSLFV